MTVGLGLGLVSMLAWADEAQGETAEPEMVAHQLVLLMEEWVEEPAPDHQLKRMVNAHEHYMKSLLRSDASVISGPIVGDDTLREVAVLKVESTEQAREIFERAPAVRIGQQTIEVYTWWAAEGILQKPKNDVVREDCYLGLLKRPDRPKYYDKEKMEEIQRGHLENIQKMADSGDLVIAGPIEEDGELRGILVFRTRDLKRIEGLVAEDPAIQYGRLRLELYRWQVPRGILPEPESKS